MEQGIKQLVVDNVSKLYGFPPAPTRKVLSGLSLVVSKGDFIAIKGPSGSGKSTMLNIIGGLDRPTGGQVVFRGIDLAVMGEEDICDYRLNQIGFVFQEHHLLPQLTVMENILLPAMPGNARGNDGRQHDYALGLARRFGLEGRTAEMPNFLSGGEKQRAAVIRSLINRPMMILADEPTGSLDRENALKIADMLAEINSHDSTTVILVTHSDEIAAKARKTYLLKDGRLEKTNSHERPD